MEKLTTEQALKAFSAARECQFVLSFPNGNRMSTVWGFGTYTENHFPNLDEFDFTKGLEVSKIGCFFPHRGSDNAEVMYWVDKKTQKKIDEEFAGESNPIGYLTIDAWYKLLKIIAE